MNKVTNSYKINEDCTVFEGTDDNGVTAVRIDTFEGENSVVLKPETILKIADRLRSKKGRARASRSS